jgi:hypothetical protein
MITSILSRIKLNSEWVTVDMSSFNDCYAIAVKETAGKNDTIDPETIKIITFEIGIDSGIKNKPITISRFSLNFNELTSSDVETNKLTAFAKLSGLPSNFYIRPLSMDDGKKTITAGEVAIALNINPVIG